MSTSHDSENFHFEVPTTYKKRYLRLNNNVILKSKENLRHCKCTKTLIKKLTKYKLRKNSIEDPDILDISNTFHLRLQIKSPTKNNSNESLNNENNFKVTNYLFKMVRNKKNTDKISKNNCKNDVFAETEETIQTPTNKENKNANAFHIMMKSRNKVIGTNSPGKDRKDDTDSDSEERKMLKAAKLKRAEALQKMAESKGLLINNEREKYKDDCIKKIIDDRAEKFKEMLTHGGKLQEIKKSDKILAKETHSIDKKSKKKSVNIKNKDNDSRNIISLIDIDLFTPPKEEVHDEFFDKLSPSLRNRDMLCYFKKIEKHSNNDIDCIDEDNLTEVNDNVIKVKLMSGKKNKKKKNIEKVTKALKIIETNSNHIDNNAIENNDDIKSDVKNTSRKRKRNNLVSDSNKDVIVLDEINETSKDLRPKRKVKKPLKYDSFSSSDDDFLIFTAKKKKTVKNATNKIKAKSLQINTDTGVTELNDNKNNKNDIKKTQKKAKNFDDNKLKLAPIFMSKPQTDSISLEAKKKFLQSGVPEQIKKIQLQASKKIQGFSYFVTQHIQQLNITQNNCVSPINYYGIDYIVDVSTLSDICAYDKILHFKSKEEPNVTGFMNDVTKSLKNLKDLYPEFPVYRTYQLLKNKCSKKNYVNINFDNSSEVITQLLIDEKSDDPMTLNWTEKYRIPYAKDIIGNFEGLKELKRWLQSWQENEAFTKKNIDNSDSESSDFLYYSDADSRDSMRGLNNILILVGPTGCGKTSSVYAIATELSMKVIEVNASSKRTGKIILQDLQEATQSHKVNRTKGTSSENSQNSQEFKNLTKPKKKSKDKMGDLLLSRKKIKSYSKVEPISHSQTESQSDMNRTEMSLILIDDADIIFDQDDGFVAALSQIVQCSKRPVILVTSSMSCPHLNKFYQCGNVVKLKSLMPRILGTWLDIMCVSETKICWPGLGAKCLEFNKGDIRKTINYLNYLVLSESNKELDDASSENTPLIEVEDESFSLSWVDNEINIKKLDTNTISPTSFLNFINGNKPIALNSMTLWWNLPKIIDTEHNVVNADDDKNLNTLIKMTNVLDCLSLTDTLKHFDSQEKDSTTIPWQYFEIDGVSENENMFEYNSYVDNKNEISDTMIKCSLLEMNSEFEKQMDNCLPEAKIQRATEKKIEMHNSLTNSLSNCSILDRRSLATDYWSICRNICRIERNKIDNHSKRNNRFCHYLKSLKSAKSESFHKLCESLQVDDV